MDKPQNPDLRSKIAFVVQHIPGGALLFAVLSLVVLGYLGWYYYGADHLDQALYALRLEKLTVTQQPPWIKTNIAEEVYNNSRLDRLSLLDSRATSTVAQAFEAHEWVKTTQRVNKTVGGKVVVELVYRRPAAMIYVTSVNKETGVEVPGFLPIDNQGTLLPSEPHFAPDDVWNYFQIFAKDAEPTGRLGMPFGDVRIMEALKLCEFLEKYREPLGLAVIEVSQDNLASGPSPWVLHAFTRDKRREIIWGHAPRLEGTGELPADEKLKRLLSWMEKALPAQSTQTLTLDLRYASSMTPVSTRRN